MNLRCASFLRLAEFALGGDTLDLILDLILDSEKYSE